MLRVAAAGSRQLRVLLIFLVQQLRLVSPQPVREWNDRLQAAAARFVAGEDMDCQYPAKNRWWQSLSQEAIPILRERNPNAMYSACVHCLLSFSVFVCTTVCSVSAKPSDSRTTAAVAE